MLPQLQAGQREQDRARRGQAHAGLVPIQRELALRKRVDPPIDKLLVRKRAALRGLLRQEQQAAGRCVRECLRG